MYHEISISRNGWHMNNPDLIKDKKATLTKSDSSISFKFINVFYSKGNMLYDENEKENRMILHQNTTEITSVNNK